jgi:hypothetical protein
MREKFDDDYAANRAVAEVIKSGRLKMKRRIRFECIRRMDRLSEFETLLADLVDPAIYRQVSLTVVFAACQVLGGVQAQSGPSWPDRYRSQSNRRSPGHFRA